MTFQKKFGKRPATIKSNSQDRESDARSQKNIRAQKFKHNRNNCHVTEIGPDEKD